MTVESVALPVVVNQTYVVPEGTVSSSAPPPPPPPPGDSAAGFGQAPPPPPPSYSATDGAREATVPKPMTREEIEKEAEDRLISDPSYRAEKEKYEMLQSIKEGFMSIDGGVQGFSFDGLVELWDLEALVGRADAPEGAKEAARLLLAHPDLWLELKALTNNGNRVSLDVFRNVLAASAEKLKGLKDGAKKEVKEEDAQRLGAAQTGGANPGAQTGSTSAPATQTPEEAKKAAEAEKKAADAKAIMAEADQALPKPAPSQFSGLEGASENLNNMVGWAEAETDRLTKLMGKTDDPAVLKQLEMKINQMSRRMQQMTALMNQIMTAMQNISKMYSDIAMNSVRNMR
ncbi:MAG: hypothetical protein Q8L48_06850 [Archangium sp.]|nr:hypothetical protein [Archangium sp.]